MNLVGRTQYLLS